MQQVEKLKAQNTSTDRAEQSRAEQRFENPKEISVSVVGSRKLLMTTANKNQLINNPG